MPALDPRDVTTCGRCGARIRWTITATTHSRMPVDADPNPEGNQAVWRDETGQLRSRALVGARSEPAGYEWQAMPHFATCTSPAPRAASRPQRPRRRAAVRPGGWPR